MSWAYTLPTINGYCRKNKDSRITVWYFNERLMAVLLVHDDARRRAQW